MNYPLMSDKNPQSSHPNTSARAGAASRLPS